MDFLAQMMSLSRKEAESREAIVPLGLLEKMIGEAPGGKKFRESIARGHGQVRIIAELKKASPSSGRIREIADIASLASELVDAGAHALSVLTCRSHFEGCLDDLVAVSGAVEAPVLRKDFISVPYQVYEARAFDASAVLLISDYLSERALESLISLSHGLGMDCLVEAHSAGALEKALSCGARIVGINNRNLTTLEVDLRTTQELIPLVTRECVVVSESGIRTREDVLMMEQLGVDALLVGERLTKDPEPARALRWLLGRG